MVRRFFAVLLCSLYVASLPMAVGAADSKNQGLFIAPLRQQTSLSPGDPVPVSVQVGNLTEKPMKVNLHLKQFSVTDYTYKYTFRPLEYDWIKLPEATVTLRPGEKKQVKFTVTAPANAASGGYYFALFASTLASNQGIKTTVQAGSLLYTKVDGGKVKQSVSVLDAKMPFFITGGEIPYKFNVKNTGNVHITGKFFAQLEGLQGKTVAAELNHILLPETVKTINGTLQAPIIPGLYTLTYGYGADSPLGKVTKIAYIVFIPPWFIVAVVLAVVLCNYLLRRKSRKSIDA